MNRNRVWRAWAAIAAGALLCAANPGTAQTADVKVNGFIVTAASIAEEERYILSQKQMMHTIGEPSILAARAEALDRVIVWEIVRQKLEASGRALTAAEVDRAVAEDRSRIGDAFPKYIAILGQDEESYRRRKARVLGFKRYTEEFIAPGLSVSDEEIRAHYESENDSDATLEQATPDIRALLLRRKTDAEVVEHVKRLKAQSTIESLNGGDQKIY